jgi:DNA modification methylase
MNMDFEKRVIGDCTLYRGDSLKLASEGIFGEVDSLVTDPPYEIPNKSKPQNRGAGRGVRTLEFAWDVAGVTDHVVLPVLKYCAEKTRNAALVFCGPEQAGEIAKVLRNSKMVSKHAVWVKPYPPPPMPGNWWPSAHEPMVYGYRKGAFFGDENPGRCNVFLCDSLRYGRAEKVGHPNQKPLELVKHLVRSVTTPKGIVLDPFMGSGSTAIAALSLGHTFIGCEIDPVHFDVACRRIQAFYDRQNGGEQLHILGDL